MNQQIVTRDLGGHFKTLRQIFINVANKKPRDQRSIILLVPTYPLSGKSNYMHSATTE